MQPTNPLGTGFRGLNLLYFTQDQLKELLFQVEQANVQGKDELENMEKTTR